MDLESQESQESQDSQDSQDSDKSQETPIVENLPNVIVNYKDIEIPQNVSNLSIPGASDTTK